MSQNLTIQSIVDPGNQPNELVWLTANTDVNVASYLITDNTFDAGGASNKWRHTYQFPNLTVKKGDWIALWTKPGTYRVEDRAPEKVPAFKVHHLFMNLKTSVWNAAGDTARLFYQVQTQSVKK